MDEKMYECNEVGVVDRLIDGLMSRFSSVFLIARCIYVTIDNSYLLQLSID